MERSPEVSRFSQLVFAIAALLVGLYFHSHQCGRPVIGLRTDRDSIDLGRVRVRGCHTPREL